FNTPQVSSSAPTPPATRARPNVAAPSPERCRRGRARRGAGILPEVGGEEGTPNPPAGGDSVGGAVVPGKEAVGASGWTAPPYEAAGGGGTGPDAPAAGDVGEGAAAARPPRSVVCQNRSPPSATRPIPQARSSCRGPSWLASSTPPST